MLNKISTRWRFLFPVLILLIAAPLLLMRQQTTQHLDEIARDGQKQAVALGRLLEVTDALISEQVDASMRLLKEKCMALGAPTLGGSVDFMGKTVPNLMLGATSQTNRFDLVDSVTSIAGGTATLFVRSGNDFIRVSTNIRKRDGSRALGTLLDPHGQAISAIRAGKPFRGVVDILEDPYLTRYEPIRDPNGEIIGVSYVGYKIDMQILREAVENFRFLKSGFAAVIDHKNRVRFVSSHVSGRQVQDFLRAPPGDWAMATHRIPGWQFTVLVAYPLSEARAASLSSSWFVIGGGTLLGALLLLLIFWQLHRLVLSPIGGDPATAIDVVQRIAAGDFETDGNQATPGTLMANVLTMRTRLREMVDTLRSNAERMSLSSSVFEHANDGIFITDAQSGIVDVNPAFVTLTGYQREDVLGKTPETLGFAYQNPEVFQQLRAQGEWRGETWNKRRDGGSYAAWFDIFSVQDAQQAVSHYVGIFSDISAAKEHQKNLEHLAYHDALTQLPNRTLLSDRLQQALARTNRSNELLAVCYFDLDGFKPINDTLGHEAGDRLLVQLASRIRTCLRESDTIARMGGDEFAMLLCDLHGVEESRQTLGRLLSVINKPFVLEGQTVKVSASIGYTIFPLDDSEPDTLLRHADQAMYQAKLNGGSRYHLFDAAHDKQARDQRQMRDRIEMALEQQEFVLHYQPKVDLRIGRVVGMEALIRWQHPEDGLRYPNDFLPAIENTDLAIPLGEWVIQEALRQLSQWLEAGLDLQVSVNIAARHLTQPDFAKRLSLLLQTFPKMPASRLELEITESAAIEDIAGVAQLINSCKLLGVHFALDDFGVGYSSLTYLRRLPVETIKIDQSFVRDMLHDNEDLALVSGVISLSREFDRQVVAEGVETPEHGLQLLQMGCFLAQGYGIARPMPAAEVANWVAAYTPESFLPKRQK